MRPTVLYTCCGGAGGWSITRSLAAVDRYRLIGVDTDPLVSGLYVDALDGRYLVPPGDDPGYVDAIMDIVAKEKVDVVWPCSDEEVIALAPCRDFLAEAGARLVCAPADVISWVVDKLAVTRAVADAGVPVPLTCGLVENYPELTFPVIVRPRTGRSGKGVVFFDDLVSLKAYRDALGAAAESHFVQECVEFFPGNLYMAQAIFDDAQQQKAVFASRSIRTAYDWGGPALGGVPVRNQRLAELASQIFQATGPWFGPVNTEFLYDTAREEFIFLEVNPRYWGYSYLATAAGVNFPDITVRLALGEEVEAVTDYRMDVFTMTSREQLSFLQSELMTDIPGGDLP
jgi:carbamoyl-phosphate synthase large subunit